MDHQSLMMAKSSFVLHSADSLDGSSFGLHLTDNMAIVAHLFDNVAAEYRLHPRRHMMRSSVYGSLPPIKSFYFSKERENNN